MKNKIALALTAALIAVSSIARADIYVAAGSGVNVTAGVLTNFPTLIPVGTFTFTSGSLSQSYNNATNTASVVAYGRLTFDGVNFFTVPFNWTNTATGPGTNVTWTLPQTNYTVYASLSVSNAMGQVLTNYSALLSH